MLPTPEPATPWTRFHAAVLADETRLARIFSTPDAPSFISTCLSIAADLGLPLNAADVAAAIAAARHARLTRFAA